MNENQPLDIAAIESSPVATAEKTDGASPEPASPVEDGEAFITRMMAQKVELTEVTVQGQKFLIAPIGAGEAGESIVGEWRIPESSNKEQQAEFQKLKTADKMLIIAIQKCVVKKDETPLWTQAQVMTMYQGPKQKLFGPLIQDLYAEVILLNPILLPSANPTALKRLFGWL